MRSAHFHHLITSSNIVLLPGGSNPHSTMSPNLEAASLVTSSPPKPVSSIQHNYSNIHQPIPRPTSLTSSRTQSSNSTAESPTGGVATFSPSEGGAFTKVRTPPMEEAKKSKLAEIDDLIHLDSSISEDLVIRTLQARFVNQKFIVSHNFTFHSMFKNETFKVIFKHCGICLLFSMLYSNVNLIFCDDRITSQL